MTTTSTPYRSHYDLSAVSPIWHPFLSPLDLEHQAVVGEKTTAFGLGERPALVIVDNYYGALGDRGAGLLEAARAIRGACGPAGWAAVDVTVELLETARANGIPVVHIVQQIASPQRWLRFKWTQVEPHDEAERLRVMEIIEPLRPIAGEPVIPKQSPSSFFGSMLNGVLRLRDVDSVVLVGNSTSGCIRASAVDAASLQYWVGVVADATFDRTEASHAMSLFDVNQKYADVAQSGAIHEYFRSVGKAM